MDKRYSKVILIILAILLFAIFLIINLKPMKKKTIAEESQKTTISNNTNDYLITDKLIIGEEEREIKVLELVSHLGFLVRYQESLFDFLRISSGGLKIQLKNDINNYLFIEKLQENDYYAAYNELNTKEIVNGDYVVSYKFLKGNVLTYLKVTKSVNVNASNYEEINANLDYIISSLVLTG